VSISAMYSPSEMNFSDKKSVVIITGATGPIGSNFALEFAKHLSASSLLILSSRSRSRLGALRDQIHDANPDLTVALIEWDLAHPDAKVFRDDIHKVTETSINYAGTPIRLKSSKYEQAILIHNAAILGDMSHRVKDIGIHVEELQESFNVNVVSLLALSSIFLDIFKNANVKTIVNMTAPSANEAYPSFGYTSISKSAKQMALNILAKEEPEIKVLHFNPVAVDTEAFRDIRDHSHAEDIRHLFAGFYTNKKLLDAKQVAHALVHVLSTNKFTSGDVVTATDAAVQLNGN